MLTLLSWNDRRGCWENKMSKPNSNRGTVTLNHDNVEGEAEVMSG